MYFVTGATGFLGGHIVCQMLIEEMRVVALKRPNSSLEQLETIAHYYAQTGAEVDLHKIDWVEGDLFSEEAIKPVLNKAEGLVHAGGLVSFHPKDIDLLYQTNAQATRNLVNWSLEEGLGYFLHISSVSTLGGKGDEMINEKSMFREENKSHYAKSKYLAELEAHRASAEGMAVGIVNPSIILGVGDWKQGTAHFFDLYGRNFPFYGVGSTGFVMASDVAKVACVMAKEKKADQFLLNQNNYTFKEIFDTIALSFSAKCPSLAITPFRAELAWRLFAFREFLLGKKSFFSADNARSAAQIRNYDGSKIKKAIPFFQYNDVLEKIQSIADFKSATDGQ